MEDKNLVIVTANEASISFLNDEQEKTDSLVKVGVDNWKKTYNDYLSKWGEFKAKVTACALFARFMKQNGFKVFVTLRNIHFKTLYSLDFDKQEFTVKQFDENGNVKTENF